MRNKSPQRREQKKTPAATTQPVMKYPQNLSADEYNQLINASTARLRQCLDIDCGHQRGHVASNPKIAPQNFGQNNFNKLWQRQGGKCAISGVELQGGVNCDTAICKLSARGSWNIDNTAIVHFWVAYNYIIRDNRCVKFLADSTKYYHPFSEYVFKSTLDQLQRNTSFNRIPAMVTLSNSLNIKGKGQNLDPAMVVNLNLMTPPDATHRGVNNAVRVTVEDDAVLINCSANRSRQTSLKVSLADPNIDIGVEVSQMIFKLLHNDLKTFFEFCN